MDTFLACHKVNDLLIQNKQSKAREKLIKVLDYFERKNKPYDAVLNHLIRQVGLYPYLQTETATWQDRFAYESFKVDVGSKYPLTLHREQSSILKKLISGKNLAISAPTSFGKSFIIDSFIALSKPENIVIIVPTIALTDETRRRLHKKFSREYTIITTSDVELGEKNILIFPQERAIQYVDKLNTIDMLVIDEFYKASPKFDKERSPSLLNAILKLGEKSHQRYFLAPNISSLNNSMFTKGMEFLQIDFSTVYLEKYDLYKVIDGDETVKSSTLLNILKEAKGKTLIYAGTYTNITAVSNLFIDSHPLSESRKLQDFSSWLSINYDVNWKLTNLVKRGSGIHNGQLHRSLSQIQIKLFEEDDGLKNLVSTSSIIEGVNTSAENVIIWRNKNGSSNLNDFTYKNIIGRGGRMFKHFIGKIYILEPPPKSSDTELDLEFPDELIGSVDEEDFRAELSKEQIAKIISYKEEMGLILGSKTFSKLQSGGGLSTSNSFLIRDIATDIKDNSSAWNGLGYLNSDNVNNWGRLLYKIMKLQPSVWGVRYGAFIEFVKVLSRNWDKSIPELLSLLSDVDIGIDDFFKLERIVTYNLSSLVNDINVIQIAILKDKSVDISSFVSKLSYAFLPPVVYQLEEYGLPRMITKKLHQANVLDFEDSSLQLHDCLDKLNQISIENIIKVVPNLNSFDVYILKYFFEGISSSETL